MDLKLFIRTAPWLPIFILIGYAILQFVIGKNQLIGFIGMMIGLVLWLLLLIITYVKSDSE